MVIAEDSSRLGAGSNEREEASPGLPYMTLHLISYGISRFDPLKFSQISNSYFSKPGGGLWASPVGVRFGWREWCLSEDFGLERLDSHIEFAYRGRVLIVDCVEDLDRLRWFRDRTYHELVFPDFEAMLASGVDAIWLTERGENATRYTIGRNLYGWDCECVLVMNPQGIDFSESM